MMIVAIDVETNDLPRSGIKPGDAQYPWPVQIGAVLFDFDGRDRAQFGSRVRADGRSISIGAAAVHGISSREASKAGVPEIVALGAVCAFAAEARIMTGFNVCFDRGVLESALIRLGKETRKLVRPGLQIVDLMLPSAPICKLQSGREDGAYKFPKLSEALTLVRNERPRKGHDAIIDAKSAKRLFLSLYHRGMLDLGEAA